MPTSLPYLSTPGSITTALNRIRSAATPERVTTDFINTILQMKGGTGNTITPFLKKMGFVAADGTPTELYRNFRNANTGGRSIAEAIKLAYRPLLDTNEYFYKLSDTDLTALIVQVTGLDADNRIVKLVLSTLNNVKAFADFKVGSIDNTDIANDKGSGRDNKQNENAGRKPFDQVGLNLSYTINLNLPATSDQAVFNAIFKSLKEHLLTHE